METGIVFDGKGQDTKVVPCLVSIAEIHGVPVKHPPTPNVFIISFLFCNVPRMRGTLLSLFRSVSFWSLLKTQRDLRDCRRCQPGSRSVSFSAHYKSCFVYLQHQLTSGATSYLYFQEIHAKKKKIQLTVPSDSKHVTSPLVQLIRLD